RAGQSHTRYAHRLRSELQLLSPGYRLTVTVRSAPANTPHAEGDRLRVLHLLTNSLPHTQSGYSLRSHRILTAMRDQGIESVALTRTGYPVMIGIPTAADEDVVDRSEEHTSELQSRFELVCRLLLEKKKKIVYIVEDHA